MNERRNIQIYASGRSLYELIFFEDLRQWHIRCTDKQGGVQSWSETGYETPQEGMQAFEGRVTYVTEPPGKS